MLDIQLAQRNMRLIQPVTVEIARILLRGGQEAIGGAQATAKQPWYKVNLPGSTSRENVAAHLQWHADKLSMMQWGIPSDYVYDSGEDLKKWTMQAYIEANAAEEGAAYLEQSWNAMLAEIQQKLAAIPKAVRDAALAAASGAFEAVTGVPLWAIILGGVAVAGIGGYVYYKAVVLQSPARRWLP